MINTHRTLLLTKLKETLDKLIATKATGTIVLINKQILGEIFIFSGRILYVAHKVHRVRRWQRAIERHCPTWKVPPLWSDEQPWEYGLLAEGISKKELHLNQVKSVISDVTLEFFTELCYETHIKTSWKPQEMVKSPLSYCLTLPASEIHPIITEVENISHNWNNAGFDRIQPNLAPILNNSGLSETLPIPKSFLSGESTVWDIAAGTKKSIIKVTELLLPWLEKGAIELKSINDSRMTTNIQTSVTTNNAKAHSNSQSSYTGNKKKGVIACIDDSPVVVHNLKKILSGVGYETVTIQEPMAGFGELMKHKPDLILLDLNMPNANGYSVCKFLRESEAFAKTPIVILTSQDTAIDRTRAKLVGATDFIAKPPEPQQLLQMIELYLDGVNSSKSKSVNQSLST